jgi:hypothetical protein
MGRYYFGQIVEAWVPDGNGSTALHPVVLIDNDEQCNSGDSILGIFVSSSPTDPCPYYHIQLHDDDTKDKTTGFYCRCWAKCNMPRIVEPRRIERTWGNMPDGLLKLVVDMSDTLEDLGDDFPDWQ